MPGTDMCIKIGGWVRAEVTWGVNGSSTTGLSGTPNYNNGYTNSLWTRERGYITADAREQTAYGVARGYIAVGVSTNNNGTEVPGSATFSSNPPSCSGRGSRPVGQCHSTTSTRQPRCSTARATCRRKIPATAAGGCGVTPPSSAAASRPLCRPKSAVSAQIIDLDPGITPPGAIPGDVMGAPGTNGTILAGNANAAGYGGWQTPDIVANLRVNRPGAAPKSWAPCTRMMPVTTALFRPMVTPAMHGVGSWAAASKSMRRSSRPVTISSVRSPIRKVP